MNDRSLDNVINNYYQNSYVENDRLTKDKAHYLEFITTTKYIDKYLKNNDRILEVGAGTGAYSLYYANHGYQVDAVELVQTNVDVMKGKITDSMNLKAIQGNALDLSMYEDNTFDITLVLGPLYHLFKEEEINKAITEAVRVTKKNGIIYFAFCLFDSTMITWGFQGKNIYNNYGEGKQVTPDFKPVNKEELVFNLRYYKDVKELIEKFNIVPLHYVATDGVGRMIKDTINNMSEEEYQLYMNYHMSICEREDLIGYSGHILSIVRKK